MTPLCAGPPLDPALDPARATAPAYGCPINVWCVVRQAACFRRGRGLGRRSAGRASQQSRNGAAQLVGRTRLLACSLARKAAALHARPGACAPARSDPRPSRPLFPRRSYIPETQSRFWGFAVAVVRLELVTRGVAGGRPSDGGDLLLTALQNQVRGRAA
jgi:hypothetical protein